LRHAGRKARYGAQAALVVGLLASMAGASDFTVAVEAVEARGVYQVRQQPSAENGWQVVVRVDGTVVGRGNAGTAIALWALPPE